MARAKRTDRAEARRQYRAYLAAQAEARAAAAETEAEEPAESAGAVGRPARTRAVQTGAQPGQRLGMFAAARAAFRTPTYVDDLRNIGPLVFRTNAIWPVAAICLIAAVVAYTRITPESTTTSDPIIAITIQFILSPIPLLPPMLAGFLAPRSTWLAGALAALISSLTLLALVTATSLKLEGSTTSITSANVAGITISLLAEAIPFGALIGAASGWYKRFLNLMGGGRQRGRSKPSGQKRPVRRGQTARR